MKIAIIGCGAVTEQLHLPALAALSIRPVLLVDRNLQRAQDLADTFNVSRISDDYDSWVGEFDAAIIALPHHLHAPVCIDLLRAGCQVLVEKPMALSSEECDQMIETARAGSAVLAVGLMRRFLRSAQFAKWVVSNGLLGRIESFDFREGNVYNWPVTSDFFFRRETAGGGVLFDTGAHTLDLLLWWLGDVASFEYFDDSYGGVEADCELSVTMESGAKGTLELSRTRNLRNTAIIRGERAELEVHLRGDWVSLRSRDGTVGVAGYSVDRPQSKVVEQSSIDLFSAQLQDWLDAIRIGRLPTVSGTEARKSVALIEACYAQRQLLQLPWVEPCGHQERTRVVTT